NLRPAFAHGETLWGALLSALLVLQIVPYYMAGFETVSRVAENRTPGLGGRRFVGIVLAAIVRGVAFYAAVILVVVLLAPGQETVPTEDATLTAFRRAFGSDVLVNLILFGAILSLVKVFNGCLLSASQMLFAMGRSKLAWAGLGEVDSRSQTPRRAILCAGAFAALGCLLGKSV